jgi:hypothetical protein
VDIIIWNIFGIQCKFLRWFAPDNLCHLWDTEEKRGQSWLPYHILIAVPLLMPQLSMLRLLYSTCSWFFEFYLKCGISFFCVWVDF